MKVSAKLLASFLVAGAVIASPVVSVETSAENEIVIEVESATEIAAYLKKIHFFDIRNHPERLQAVPRTRILRIPSKLKDVWKENVTLRKSIFFRLGLSAVLQANEKILADRQRLLAVSLKDIGKHDSAWLSKLFMRYKVAKHGDLPTPSQLEELKLRVDILPPSLVIVQAAVESGWCQSRFARKGQAIFGQWTTAKSGIKALKSDVRLAAFKNPRESLVAYLLNLNTHLAYADLRNARAAMRRNGRSINGYALAKFMNKYAETGETYVKLLRHIIRSHNLTLADTARLAQGSRILFRRVDQK